MSNNQILKHGNSTCKVTISNQDLTEEKEMKMQKDMVKCPKDSEVMYSREVCETVFRKGDIRIWCKSCEVFSKDQPEPDQRQAPSA